MQIPPGSCQNANSDSVALGWGYPAGSMVKIPPASTGDADVGSVPGLGRSLGGEHGNSLQYSSLGNPMD